MQTQNLKLQICSNRDCLKNNILIMNDIEIFKTIKEFFEYSNDENKLRNLYGI